MKKNLNEIKRMQQLAGLINESQLNEDFGDVAQDALESGDAVRITPKTKIKVGDRILSLNGAGAEVIGIMGDKYKIEWDMDGDRSQRSRANLEKYFLIEK